MNKPTNILLAEDDADDRELFLEAISMVAPEINVATFENGEKLMDHLNGSRQFPDCIFLDLNMPKKNGNDCLSEIRENQKTQQIPVIIYTTSLSTKDIDETYRRGATCFIRKPNSFRELKDLLSLYLNSAFINPGTRMKGDFVLNPR